MPTGQQEPREIMPEPPKAVTDAVLFIKHCYEHVIDYTTVFLLQMPDEMQKKNRACEKLKEICEGLGVEVCSEFLFNISGHLHKMGVMPVTPTRFVAAKYKAQALEAFERAKEGWGEPCSPLFVQVCGDDWSPSIFIIFCSAQDAILKLMEIKRDGKYAITTTAESVIVDVKQITEQVIPGSPSYAILDTEMYLSHFEGRVGRERLEAILDEFPLDIMANMSGEGVLDDGDGITVYAKDKSREVRGDFKCSRHFITNLWGTAELHQVAIHLAMRRDSQFLKNCTDYCKENKNFGCIKDLEDPNNRLSILALDKNALPGGPNGFQMILSHKKTGDPLPRWKGVGCYRNGVEVWKEAFDKEVSLDMPGKELALLIFESLYTVPKFDMRFYKEGMLAKVRPFGSV
jgi:hypothetical protein